MDNSGSALVSDLKRYNATGFFPLDIVREIREEPDSVSLAVRKLLDDHFPESLHHSILERVGLSLESAPSRKSSWKVRRDPKFRENVLHAYGYSCAVCGFRPEDKDSAGRDRGGAHKVAPERRPGHGKTMDSLSAPRTTGFWTTEP